MDGIKIGRLQYVEPYDRRGPTYEWKFPSGHQITVFEREKGTKFGGHYHKDEDPSKNPERFYLVRGRLNAVLFMVPVVGPAENPVRLECAFEAGDTIEIYPYTYHKMEALEDCIFIEYRVTHFDPNKPDTYSV